ncbi:vomeronasal type-2 receptor 26 [Xenopus tropicalis]|uniref:Vomeronasal type-2 receptor 26 n=1 Tax=Xenopus tropicalis TaxID=8364 RepID=A0A8J0T0F7_XENTR|nr:vomeronasal type-2 receptor 26 [Xenopus tropicalis]
MFFSQINQFVRNVIFTTFPNDTHSFNKHGDPPARFNIVKWLFLPGNQIDVTKVGSFNASDHETQLYINSSADLWGPHFNMTPELLCNAPCAPGYRKSKREGAPSCCYDCVPCVDGEMSNTSDAPSCFRCPGYEMSNKQRTACVPKMINYLSYEETLGASLASIALVLFLTTSAVQGVFVKYWKTPIVRANNRNLSCLLLISLMLCFLCTLLFIGRPTQICCLLRQVTFGIVFTISVSSVLAKTLTVIIAFNATKPGSKLKKYVGTQLPIVLVTICSLGEIGICLIWMASDPPFVEVDILSERDTIILQCNEGSVTFFFCIIGYIGTLALLSFIAAFLAKDFPDRFNEAKNITFSMLGFCSVWGAFVPAYLSSKGSRMVAVEIFAILSSSAGLLGCIFAPKCYIIFLRPQLNTKVIAQ